MVLMLQFRRLQCNEEQCIKRKQMLINCMILRCENDERCSQEVISACMYTLLQKNTQFCLFMM